MQNPLVIVLGLNYTARLGVVRALGSIGCDIIDVSTLKNSGSIDRIDMASRYVSKYHICGSNDEELLLSTIRRYRNKNRDVFLFPTDDYPASVIDKHLDELSKDFFVPNIAMKQGAIVKIMDKSKQKELAKQCGFDVAESWIIEKKDDSYIIPRDIIYPCFVKPLESYSSFMKGLMTKANDESELKNALNAYSNKGYDLPLLVEQFIEIDHEYVLDGVSMSGHSIHPVIIEKDLIYHGVTASGRLLKTTSLPDVGKKIKLFFETLQFTGLYDVELFESRGKIYFNELNVRIGACGYAFIKTVANYPQILMDYLKNGRITSITDDGYNSKTFASEKPCMQLLRTNTISLSTYYKTLNRSDFRFLKQKSDMKPYYKYLFLSSLSFLKLRIIGR